MKKILIPGLLLLILTSCGSSSTSSDAVKAYKGAGFSLNVPTSWTNVDPKELPTTKNGKIELALSSAEISAGFANNLVVLSENIVEKTSSVKYAIANYVRTTGTVQEYTKLNEQDFTFSDKDDGKLYTFEAKYSAQTPMRKFLQTAKVCDTKAYLITIGINTDNANVAKYENLLKSFACTK